LIATDLRDDYPAGSAPESLLALLHAASALCNLDDAKGEACPLCKRAIADKESELFKRYRSLIVNDLEKEITALKEELNRASEVQLAVSTTNYLGWRKYVTVQPEFLSNAIRFAEIVVKDCTQLNEPNSESNTHLIRLKELACVAATHVESKTAAIDAAMKGQGEVSKRLQLLRAEIEPLEYAQTIANCIDKLSSAKQRAKHARFWRDKLPAFTQVLKKITDTSKEAHEDLVVSNFEEKLNAEYKLFAEKEMAAFGVKLARKGQEAAITVLPQVGLNTLQSVMSEGEQRLHALALFFAEVETCTQSVLVFDDPVSSFDYNYIANFCSRLRDLAQRHPTKQIILLTHNLKLPRFDVHLKSSNLLGWRVKDEQKVNGTESPVHG
jgi:uncharacterized small protein (DUF1192 family)